MNSHACFQIRLYPACVIHDHIHPRTSQLPPVKDATKQDREALQQELGRVLRTANESDDYASISADTHDEVAMCEKVIEDMLAHEVCSRVTSLLDAY